MHAAASLATVQVKPTIADAHYRNILQEKAGPILPRMTSFQEKTMQRRQFLKATAASAIGLPLTASSLHSLTAYAAPAEAATDALSSHWRNYAITQQIVIAASKELTRGVNRVWLPLPLLKDTDYQRTLEIQAFADGAQITTHLEPRYQARLLSVEWPNQPLSTTQFNTSSSAPLTLQLITRVATRHRQVDLKTPQATSALTSDERALWLEATELLPTDGIVKQYADEIAKTLPKEATTVQHARAIYDWVVDHTFREATIRGCGIGDVKSMLESGNLGGKCADINAVFVALARASGIPARDVYGIRIDASVRGYKSLGKAKDITRAQHCRAEFFADGFGWIPVDPADVRKVALEEEKGGLPLNDPKVMAIREYLFGHWEMNWLGYNYAHDLDLPGSTLGKIGFLMYPNGETSEGRLDPLDPDHFSYRISSRALVG